MINGQTHSLSLAPITLSRLLERMGYYGMRSILILYLIKHLGFTSEHATSVYAILTSLLGILPILGGLLADLLIGSRIATMIGAGLQALGCFVIAIPNEFTTYIGLFILAFGTGLYSPNIISTLAYAYREKGKLMDSAMFILYIGINIGAAVASFLIPSIAEHFGYAAGFIFAGILQLGALVVLLGFIPVMKEIPFRPNLKFEDKKENQLKTEWRIIGLILLFIFIPVFWIIYEGGNSTLYGLMYRSNAEGSITNFSTISALVNPLVTVVLGIILAVVWTFVEMNSFLKMTIGFFIFALAWLVLLFIPYDGAGTQVGAFIIMVFALQGVAELFISPISLSFICRYAPVKFNATIIGVNLSLITLLSGIVSFVAVYADRIPIQVMGILLAGVSVVIAAVFMVMYFLMRKDPSENQNV